MIPGFILIFLTSVHLSLTAQKGREAEIVFMDFPPEFSKEERLSHLASSIEDLSVLFLDEAEAFKLVERSIKEVENIKEAVKLKKKLDTLLSHKPESASNMTLSEAVSFISHPINSYHLLQRSAYLWPKYIQITKKFFSSLPKKISKRLTNIPKQLSKIQFATETDFTDGAINGLFNLQNYYELRSEDVAEGKILESDRESERRTEISSEQCVVIAEQAGRRRQLHLAVDWLLTALQRAGAHSNSNTDNHQHVARIRKLLKKAKETHDDYIISEGFLNLGMEEIRVMTQNKPYSEALAKSEEFLANKEIFEAVMRVDWRDEGKVNQFAQNYLQRDYVDRTSMMYQLVVTLAQEPHRRQLCRGEIPVRPVRSDLLGRDYRCVNLHYNNPFLKLGPFSLEILNLQPFIGTFHRMFTERETDLIIEKSKGRLKPTPYFVDGELLSYSARRTSKLLYLSDKSSSLMRSLSGRVELATQFNLTHSRLDSENYQIMNYGVGGLIDAHQDSAGYKERAEDVDNTVEAVKQGGLRTMTWMIYLTDVEAGGRTVFTGNNLAVRPERGSALFWLNHRSDGLGDLRTFHTGCPVLLGNKWIANKWVKWHGSMWSYPCHRVKGKHYRHFNNQGRRF